MHHLKLDKSVSPGWDRLSPRDKAIFDRLPPDYREFLHRNNGGFVSAACPAHFSIAMERRQDEQLISSSEQNWIEECFAVIPSATEYTREYGESPASLFHEYWRRHVDEEILPYDVFVFASCDQGCLLALSINPEDYGAVYYWEWYWYYPWFSKFFNARVEAARSAYPEIDEVLNDASHPLHREAFNASNYATLVKVAGSFTELIQSLKHEDRADA